MSKRKHNSSPSRVNSAPIDLHSKKFRADGGEGSSEPFIIGLKSTLYSNIYHLELLMHAVKRGHSFALVMENNAAEQLDNVVFKYEDRITGDKLYRFLQANDKDFSLQKYFISYRKIKQNPKFIGCKLKDFVICNDIDLAEELRSSFEPVEGYDNIFTVSSMNKECKRLKFKESFPQKNTIFIVLRETSEHFQLAKTLACCIIHNQRLELNDDLFRSYHHVLCQKVLERKKREGKSLWVFRANFIDGSKVASDIENFRMEFYNAYLYISQQEMCEDFFFESMKEVELHSSTTFGDESEESLTSLPNDNISDAEIELFLRDLIFGIYQSNDKTKEDMCVRETSNSKHIEVMVRELQRHILKWMKSKEDSSTEINDFFFQETTQKIFKLSMISQTIEYCNQFETLGIEFDEKIKELDLFLNSKNKNFFNLITNQTSTMLSAIKVYQTINKNETYKKKYDNIFMKLDTLLLKQIQNCVIAISQSTTTNHLLVVECESTKKDVQEAKTQLLRIINLNEMSGNKVILVTQANDYVAKQIRELYSKKAEVYEEKIDKKSFFMDLTQSSKKNLLQTGTVTFQGNRMNLDTLMENPSEALLGTIDGELLTKFINKQDVWLGELGKDINYNQIADYIIKPLIYHHNLDKKASKLRKSWFILSDNQNHQLSMDTTNKDIMQYEPQTILDVGSKVVIIAAEPGMGKSIMLSYLAINSRSIQAPVWFVRCNSSDYVKFQAGRKNEARSRVMEAIRFLYEIPNFQLFRKLDECNKRNEKGKILEKLLTMENDDEMNFNFLEKCYNGKIFLKNEEAEECKDSSLSLMEMELFTHYYNNGQIVLLFDGFDEISPKYKDAAIELLQNLQRTKIRQIWITTRFYNDTERDILEKNLQVFSYSIQPFGEKEQNIFLRKFLKKNLNGGVLNEDRLNICIDEVLNSFSLHPTDWERKFIGVPLRLYMVANIFNETFNDINKSDDSDITGKIYEVLCDKWDLVNLYKKFIKEKFRIALTHNSLDVCYLHRMRRCINIIYLKADDDNDDENGGNNDDPGYSENGNVVLQDIEEVMRKTYEILAVHLLFSEPLFEKKIKYVKKLTNMIEKGIEKTGIIHKITDDKPEFVHISIAEYLAANYLWEKFRSIRINEFENFVQSHIIEKVIENAELQLSKFFQLIVIDSLSNQTCDTDEMMVKLTILSAKLLDVMKKHCFRADTEVGAPKIRLVHQWQEGSADTICRQSAEVLLKIFEDSSLLEHNDRIILDNFGDSIEQYSFLCLCAHYGYIQIGNAIGKEIEIETLKLSIEHDVWHWSPLCVAARNDCLKEMGILLIKYSDWVQSWIDVEGKYLIHEVMECPKIYWRLLELFDFDKPYSEGKKQMLPMLEFMRECLSLDNPLEVMTLITKRTNFDIVNKYIHSIATSEELLQSLIGFKEQHFNEMMGFAIKRGMDFSKTINLLLYECIQVHHPSKEMHFTENLSSPLDKLEWILKCRAGFPRPSKAMPFTEDVSSTLEQIELLLNCGAGYNYKNLHDKLTTFQHVKQIYNIYLILNIIYEKYRNDDSSNPLHTILRLILECIAKCPNFEGYKIIIACQKVSLLPHYNNESHLKTAFLLPEYTQKIDLLPQYMEELLSNSGAPGTFQTGSFWGNLLNTVKKLVEDSDHSDLHYIEEKEVIHTPSTSAGSTTQIRRSHKIQIYDTNDELTEIKKHTSKIIELIHAINEALAENKKNLAKIKKFITRLKELEDQEKIHNVEEILQIIHIKSEHTEELHRFTSDGIYLLIKFWPYMVNAGPRKITEILEQIIKWLRPFSRLYRIFENLDNLYKALIKAIKNENYRQLDEVLQENPYFIKAVINGQDDEFGSPLHYAAYKGDLQTTERLLIDGANPILRLNEHAKFLLPFTNSGEYAMENEDKVWNYENWSSLHLAALNDNDQVIQKLIKHGAEVNATIYVKTTHEGETALHACALSCCSSIKSAQVLLENGAQYDVKNIQGKTPLDLAKPDTEIKKLLNYINELFEAVKGNNINAVNCLLKKIDSDKIVAILKTRNIDNKTLIQTAKANKQTDISDLLEGKLKPVGLNDDLGVNNNHEPKNSS